MISDQLIINAIQDLDLLIFEHRCILLIFIILIEGANQRGQYREDLYIGLCKNTRENGINITLQKGTSIVI